MKICLDIDNTIRDCATPMLSLYNERYGCSMTKEDIISYDIDITFPKLKEEGLNGFKFFFEDHADEVFEKAQSYHGAALSTQILHERGHEIIIVSYQPSLQAKIHALEWLKKNDIYYDNIVFTNSPSKKFISDMCDVIVDDRSEYLDESVARTVCIDFPYNRKKAYDIRVNSFKDWVSEIVK